MGEATVTVTDIDGDGQAEVVLRNAHLYAVLSPDHGGRLTHLFARGPRGGVLVVGNPTDDWNFQQDLNRFMDRPANHPGGLADLGGEHDRYRVSTVADDGCAHVELVDVEQGSRLRGTRKTFLLLPDSPALLIGYRVGPQVEQLRTETCLSPDYYRMLRRGRETLRPIRDARRRGWANGDVAVWVCTARDERTTWEDAATREVGHGFVIRAAAPAPGCHLLLGVGAAEESDCLDLLEVCRHQMRAAGTDPVAAGTEEVVE